MVVAFAMMVVAAVIGWRRATRAGGQTVDKLQYACAHGIPAFLLGMIGMTVAANMGWLG